MKNKVVIVGCGKVGMSYAYALINQKTNVNEIVLIDIDQDRLKGELEDLNHSLAFAPSRVSIKIGDYYDCSDAAIICIAAGDHQLSGETRTDLIYKNNDIFKSIINKINFTGFNGIYLIATNPVDIMTYLVCKYSGFHPSKVIGSGTTLDTARLRYILSEKLKLNPKNIHAYVIGEHGDSEFVSWSNTYVGSIPIDDFLGNDELDIIEYSVKTSAYDIIKRKGATYYGIGMALVRITNAILGNENSILTVSSFDEKNKIFIGYPTVINSDGVVKRMPIRLSDIEKKLYDTSVEAIKDIIEKVY